MQFCLDDGTTLVEKPAGPSDTPTVALPAANYAPTMKQAFRPDVPPIATQADETTPGKKRGLLPWLLGVMMVLVIGLAAVVGFILLRPKKLIHHLVVHMVSANQVQDVDRKKMITALEKRLNALGVSSYKITPMGDPASGQLQIDLPILADPYGVTYAIGLQGKLELTHVIGPPSPAPPTTYTTKDEAIASLGSNGNIPANRRVLSYKEGSEGDTSIHEKWVVVEAPAIVDGSHLRTASANRRRDELGYEVSFALDKTGADLFGAWTGANINEYLATVVNDEVKSIAFIKSQIFDQGVIDGHFSKDSAEAIALTLKSGAYPMKLEFQEERIDKE